MSYNRSYGNNSGFENAKRLHYGKIEQPISEYTHDPIGHDCVSCTKDLTGKIPNSLQCKAICVRNEQDDIAMDNAMCQASFHMPELTTPEREEFDWSDMP